MADTSVLTRFLKTTRPLLFVLVLLYAASSAVYAAKYPKMFPELSTPLYEAHDYLKNIAPVPGLEAEHEEFIAGVEHAIATAEALKLQSEPAKEDVKAYLKELRSLQKVHSKLIAKIRRSLLTSVSEDDYETFLLIAEKRIGIIFEQPGILKRSVEYYRSKRNSKRSSYLDELTRQHVEESMRYQQYVNTKDEEAKPFVLIKPLTLEEGIKRHTGTQNPTRSKTYGTLAKEAQAADVNLSSALNDYAASGYNGKKLFTLFYTSAYASKCKREYLLARTFREKMIYDDEGQMQDKKISYRVEAFRIDAYNDLMGAQRHRYVETLEPHAKIVVNDEIEIGCAQLPGRLSGLNWPAKDKGNHIVLSDFSESSAHYDQTVFELSKTYDVGYTLDNQGNYNIEWPPVLK